MRASNIAYEIEAVVKNALSGCDSALQGNDRFKAMSDLAAAKGKLLHLANQVRGLIADGSASAA